MPNRYYSSTAVESTLSAGITDVATAATVGAVTGWPTSFPFSITIDPDNSSREIVNITGVAGLNLTIARGQDGTSAQAHGLGAVVRHDHTPRDFREPQDHLTATTDVHGLAGGAAVAGTTSTQTFTNKTLTSATNTFPTSLATLTDAQTLTNKTLTAPILTEPSIVNDAVGDVPATVNAIASTTADLQRWNVNAVQKAAVNEDGAIMSVSTTGGPTKTVPPRLHISRGADATTTSGTLLEVVFDTETTDNDGMFSASSASITVQTTGLYAIVFQCRWTAAANFHVATGISVDAFHKLRSTTLASGTTDAGLVSSQVSGILYLTAAQVVKCTVLQASGSDRNIVAAVAAAQPGIRCDMYYLGN